MSAVFEGLPVKSISVENLISQRDGVMARVGQAIDTLKEAQALAVASGICGNREFSYRDFGYMLQGSDRYRHTELLEDGCLPHIRKRVDACAWNYLMHESGLRSLMDAKARKEWYDKIEKCDTPELTAQNIRATFGALYASRGEIFERGVLNCFKALSWCYKTNRPFAFGKRLVMRHLRSQVISKRGGGGTSLGYITHRNTDELDDLMRVFRVLDGKPELDHRHSMYSLVSSCNKTTDPDPENEYLSIRCFRNGNGHVTFKRPDLVDRMNQILAKHYPGALPEDRHEKARDMDGVKVA